MHEYSLVRSLLTQVRAVMKDESVAEVAEVSVSIGPLSGVEPALVQAAFDRLRATIGLGGTTLTISETALQAKCCDCGLDFDVQQFVFQCPSCCSCAVRVTGGDEFRLLNLTVVEDTQRTLNKPAEI